MALSASPTANSLSRAQGILVFVKVTSLVFQIYYWNCRRVKALGRYSRKRRNRDDRLAVVRHRELHFWILHLERVATLSFPTQFVLVTKRCLGILLRSRCSCHFLHVHLDQFNSFVLLKRDMASSVPRQQETMRPMLHVRCLLPCCSRSRRVVHGVWFEINITYYRGSQTFPVRVPLQHFHRWACTPKHGRQRDFFQGGANSGFSAVGQKYFCRGSQKWQNYIFTTRN